MPRTKDLGKYLGVSIIHNRIRKETYAGLLDRFNKRLSGLEGELFVIGEPIDSGKVSSQQHACLSNADVDFTGICIPRNGQVH